MEPEGDLRNARILSERARDIWNRNAAWWDEHVGEGNLFQRVLVGPATERLLAVREGEQVLDVACGSGLFLRRLAQAGATVVACDFSEVFIARARARTVEPASRIEYGVVDATDEESLVALGERRFDAAVSGMAMR